MNALAWAEVLIALPSETPHDAGCQELIARHLARLGFQIEVLTFGAVRNLWARRGTGQPLLVFAGHTDVVPAGPLGAWTSPPFQPTVREGHLYGRGAADMKGAIAAFMVALETFIRDHADHSGSIGLLITSDEEGPARDGTVRVVEWLRAQGLRPEYCLVGEPSCEQRLGDVLKNGRRGSLNATLRVQGRQGHVAYPALADNPIHRALPVLTELAQIRWDEGDADFPPTGLQISNIQGGTGADNVIPGTLDVRFNFRFAAITPAALLQARTEAVFARHRLPHTVQWTLSGQPFITRGGALIEALEEAIQSVLRMTPRRSTAGGTSDGRFIATLGTEVVEFGLLNATIHQVDEHVAVADLQRLTEVYQALLERLVA